MTTKSKIVGIWSLCGIELEGMEIKKPKKTEIEEIDIQDGGGCVLRRAGREYEGKWRKTKTKIIVEVNGRYEWNIAEFKITPKGTIFRKNIDEEHGGEVNYFYSLTEKITKTTKAKKNDQTPEEILTTGKWQLEKIQYYSVATKKLIKSVTIKKQSDPFAETLQFNEDGEVIRTLNDGQQDSEGWNHDGIDEYEPLYYTVWPERENALYSNEQWFEVTKDGKLKCSVITFDPEQQTIALYKKLD